MLPTNRTLTEDSRLEEIVQKGKVAKSKRKKRSVPMAEMDLQLPSSKVLNYTFLLQPNRSLVPEAVVMEKCQNLEAALEGLHFQEGVGDSVQGAVGGEDPGGGRSEGDGARQCHNL